jgi:hypothetical protein
MSQELAQDETEADAEDYEIDTLESGRHRRLSDEEDGDGYSAIDSDARSLKTLGSMRKGEVREENVVFAMGEDSDSEEDEGDGRGYKDVERRMRDESGSGSGRRGSSPGADDRRGSGEEEGLVGGNGKGD